MAPAKRRRLGRSRAVGIALTAYNVWRRVPPEHRKQAVILLRTHGPKVVRAARNYRKKPKP